LLERQGQGGAPSDQHIIMPARKASPIGKADDLFQPPPHAIALDCAPHLFRNGETHPDWPVIAAIEYLQHESCGRDPLTPADHQEIGTLPQPFHGADGKTPDASGTQAFAALPPPSGNDLTAAFGRHAGTKAMPALAHDFAGLIGPFHRCFSAAGTNELGDSAQLPFPQAGAPDAKNLAGL
jgi:hypothetical protein